MIKSDKWILARAREGMIEPFVEKQVRWEPLRGMEIYGGGDGGGRRLISYGPSSYGYDIRLANGVKVFTNAFGAIVDPKAFDPRSFVDNFDTVVAIPPNSFVLGYSIERFSIPRRTTCVILGKSTYARCGIVVHCTPAEAGWRGHLTIEISNTTPLPALVYTGEGIAQMLFFEADEDCETSYADRDGKYQDQGPEVVLPRV